MLSFPKFNLSYTFFMNIGKHKNTALATLGAGFECYDFLIFAFMAPYINGLFFDGDNLDRIVKYFSSFALGYIFRPIGGIIFGLISDKYGRKQCFISVILLMAVSTFMIGFAPVGGSIGVYILILSRILQGLAFGGEMPNAITFIHESASMENKKSGIAIGLLSSSASMGTMMAAAAIYILSSFFSHEAILEWAWRVPFLIGGFLALMCYFLRRNLIETSESKVQINLSNSSSSASIIEYTKHIFAPIRLLIKNDFLSITSGTILAVFAFSFLVSSFYLPTYFNQFYGHNNKDVSMLYNISLAFSVVIAPFIGKLLNRVNKVYFVIIVGITFSLFSAFMYKFTIYHTLVGVFVFFMIFEALLTALYVSHLAVLANLFEVTVRNTGIAICYNLGSAISSGVPVLITDAIKRSGDKYIIFKIWCGISLGFALALYISFYIQQKFKTRRLEQL